MSSLHRLKNLVNFGPQTPEFMTLIWNHFRRQMGEIEKSPHLSNDLTDRHEIWHGDATARGGPPARISYRTLLHATVYCDVESALIRQSDYGIGMIDTSSRRMIRRNEFANDFHPVISTPSICAAYYVTGDFKGLGY